MSRYSKGSWSRPLSNTLITLLAALVIAAGSLMLEDIVPLPGNEQRFSWERLIILVVASSVLAGLVVWRSWMGHKLGTLYYVSYLRGWMNDWHENVQREAGKRHLDERVVSRHLHAEPVDGVIDAAHEVREISHDLSRTMNEDSVDTGYTLAPNLLSPAALVVGYELYPWRDLHLLEFNPEDTVTWPLQDRDRRPRRPKGFAQPEARQEKADARKLSHSQSVLVTVDLTGQGRATLPTDFTPRLWICVGVFPARGEPDDATLGVKIDVRPRPDATTVTPHEAATTVVKALQAAIHDNPESTVYVILRVPKTVAIAVGFALSGRGRGGISACEHNNCRSPWRVLVPLLPDQSTRIEGMYHIMRVHPSQPSAATLAEQARAHGLILSGVQSNPGAPS